MKLSKLKKGEWFTLKPIECPKACQVWIRGEYDRTEKRYSVTNWEDINRERFLQGDREVFIDFTF